MPGAAAGGCFRFPRLNIDIPAQLTSGGSARRPRSVSPQASPAAVAAEAQRDGPVLDGDGAGVAGHHVGALPAAGLLDGGGRLAPADELCGQPAASRVRRDAVGRELVTNADLTAHRAEVRADLTALELRLIKWIVGTGVAVAGAILAGLRLLLN